MTTGEHDTQFVGSGWAEDATEGARSDAPAAAGRDDLDGGSALTLHKALSNTPAVRVPSAERDQLWMVLHDEVCTRGYVWARPLGSRTERQIGGDDTRHTELLAAMHWLAENEKEARQMDPDQLMRRLRGVAVRGKQGSARSAEADALHGMTHVTADAKLTFVDEWVA